MKKIDHIGKLSPRTTVIVSPILPTGIRALNYRARLFNRLLFSVNKWWLELNFSIFATTDNLLDFQFRCFNNPGDKIHLGRNGILELQRMIPVKCAAELLAVELTFLNSTKITLTTCYRVGTLGASNCNEIMQTLDKLLRKKMLRKFLVIGDFNLKGVNWNTGISNSSLENEFLNGFADLGLLQCINVATHNKGNILNILLTKSK